MANSTIPNLVAVTVPALTDLFGVRQNGDTRDKKLTVTQLLTLVPSSSVPDPLLLNAGAVGAPTYSFTGDPDTGVFNVAADQLALAAGGKEIARCQEVAGAEQFIVSPGFVENNPALPALAFGNGDTGFFESVDNTLRVSVGGVSSFEWSGTIFRATTGLGAAMQNESASSTNPTLIPSVQDQDTGIGSNAIDQVSIIAGGQEMARLTEVVGANQFAIKQSGASTVPELTSLGDPDTGFRWTGSNEIITIHANVRAWHFLSGSFFGENSDAPILFNIAGSATVPSICVEQSDSNTGLGTATSDGLALISGGVTGLVLRELNLGVIQSPQADLTITAFATGGQANAVQLDSGSNVLGTVATTGDSVKLPPAFLINSVVFIKNDGAESADVFPATGDDLGAGLNTAVSLASGASISFIATVANATWTQWIISVAGGGGIAAVVDDPSPQLGGDLDTNGSNIVNADTTLTSLAITAGTDPAVDGGDLDLSSGDSGVGATGNAGAVNILAGESVATTGDGGVVSIKSGAGFFQGAGGDILIEVGTGGAAGPGTSGRFFVNTLTGANAAAGLQVPIPGLTAIYGVGRSGSGPAANLELWGGYASGAGGGSIGGNLMLFGGGQGGGSGEGGDAILVGGESDTQPGDAKMVGGVATTSGPGGIASVVGGAGFGTNQDGGDVVLTGGAATGVGTDGIVRTVNASGPAFLNESSTTINPTLIPNRTDLDTGIGGTAADELSLVAGGVQIAQAKEASGANQFIISPGVVQNVPLTPSLAFGDGNTGFFESADNTLKVATGNAARFFWQANNFNAENTAGPFILNVAATSSSSPAMGPNRGDNNTGFGHGAADQLDFICGGLNCITVRTVAAARQVGFYNTTPVAQQTGVAVTDVAIHAALVSLGLITA